MATSPSLKDDTLALLSRLGVSSSRLEGGSLAATTPITGETLARLDETSAVEATARIGDAHAAFLAWRKVPAPRRGELVRLLGEELRAAKADLGRLVTLEVGKIVSEGLGEVQEMIDICDFAVGLSRQLYGLTIATERPDHRMMETWHPLGVVGVISAFNFPVAVWAWNAALALVCGDRGRLEAVGEDAADRARRRRRSFERAAARFGDGARRACRRSLIGGRDVGEALVDDPRVPLVSATGSTAHGPRGRPARRRALRPRDPRARRQQRRDRRARRPISTSRCAASPSPRWAPPASAARRCAACSCTRASTTRCVPRLRKRLRLGARSAIRARPARWSAR